MLLIAKIPRTRPATASSGRAGYRPTVDPEAWDRAALRFVWGTTKSRVSSMTSSRRHERRYGSTRSQQLLAVDKDNVAYYIARQ